MHESWHLLENEVDDAWNLWVLLTREEPIGYWVIQKIVPWWGMWTGMYEENHGIIGNRFFDPSLNKTFSYRDHSKFDPAFWGGEPIWITNQNQNHHTGVYFWVGSEVKIKGQYPTVYKRYDWSVNVFKRVDAVVDWLSDEPVDGQRLDINLALMHFNQPDRDGHLYGPESDEVTEQIRRCDNITGLLLC